MVDDARTTPMVTTSINAVRKQVMELSMSNEEASDGYLMHEEPRAMPSLLRRESLFDFRSSGNRT